MTPNELKDLAKVLEETRLRAGLLTMCASLVLSADSMTAVKKSSLTTATA